jgi:hypothetical protein
MKMFLDFEEAVAGNGIKQIGLACVKNVENGVNDDVHSDSSVANYMYSHCHPCMFNKPLDLVDPLRKVDEGDSRNID